MSLTWPPGARVRCISLWHSGGNSYYGKVGATGTVMGAFSDMATVQFDNFVEYGHDCHGTCDEGKGLWLPWSCIRPLDIGSTPLQQDALDYCAKELGR